MLDAKSRRRKPATVCRYFESSPEAIAEFTSLLARATVGAEDGPGFVPPGGGSREGVGEVLRGGAEPGRNYFLLCWKWWKHSKTGS